MKRLKSRILFEALRAEIIRGTIPPGTRLQVRQIADQFDVSDIPAREALWMLSQEKLVDMRPYRGAMVTGYSVAEMEQTFFVRGRLEQMAVELSHDQTRDTCWRDALRELTREMESAAEDDERYLSLDIEFHKELIRHCPNEVLLATIDTLWRAQVAFQAIFKVDRSRIATSFAEHVAIVDCIDVGDVFSAGELLFQHRISAASALSHVTSVETEQ